MSSYSSPVFPLLVWSERLLILSYLSDEDIARFSCVSRGCFVLNRREQVLSSYSHLVIAFNSPCCTISHIGVPEGESPTSASRALPPARSQ
jgi:hypothetical protein